MLGVISSDDYRTMHQMQVDGELVSFVVASTIAHQPPRDLEDAITLGLVERGYIERALRSYEYYRDLERKYPHHERH